MSRFTRTTFAGPALAVALVLPAAAFATGSLPALAANAATCKVTHTHAHTVTSRGSVTDRTETRQSCGRAYQKWEHVTEQSYTGSRYTEDIYRDERAYPRYRQVTDKYSWSKTGTETHTVTVKTG